MGRAFGVWREEVPDAHALFEVILSGLLLIIESIKEDSPFCEVTIPSSLESGVHRMLQGERTLVPRVRGYEPWSRMA